MNTIMSVIAGAYAVLYYIIPSIFYTIALLLLRKHTTIIKNRREAFKFGIFWPYYIVKMIVQIFTYALKDKKS